MLSSVPRRRRMLSHFPSSSFGLFLLPPLAHVFALVGVAVKRALWGPLAFSFWRAGRYSGAGHYGSPSHVRPRKAGCGRNRFFPGLLHRHIPSFCASSFRAAARTLEAEAPANPATVASAKYASCHAVSLIMAVSLMQAPWHNYSCVVSSASPWNVSSPETASSGIPKPRA